MIDGYSVIILSAHSTNETKISGWGFDELVWFARGASFESLRRYHGKTRRRGLADW